MEEKDKQLEEQNIDALETDALETEVVADEKPWEVPADIGMETETEKEKKAREKKEAKEEKAAKKQKRAERRNTKVAKAIRRISIWILAILVIFLGGYAISNIMIAQPAQLALEQSKADLVTAEEEIASLQSEIERLSSFEATNESLESDMEAINTHITVLSARVAVADAQLALYDGDIASVKLELGKAEETFKTLKTMLSADQKDAVESMEGRLQLVIGELEGDTSTATSDLQVLSTKLLALENTLFANP